MIPAFMIAGTAAVLEPRREPAFDPGWLVVLALLRAEGSRLPLRLASLDLEGAAQWAPLLPILIRHTAAARSWARSRVTPAGQRRLLGSLLEDDEVRRLLHVHTHDGIVWFDRDGFRTLARGLVVAGLLGSRSPAVADRAAALLGGLREAEDRSGYRLERLLGGPVEARRSRS